MKNVIILLSMVVAFEGCLPDYEKVNQLNLSYSWYCNLWGTPVVSGCIKNKGKDNIAWVELRVVMQFKNAEKTTKTIRINKAIGANGELNFRETIYNPNKEDPNAVEAVITDAG